MTYLSFLSPSIERAFTKDHMELARMTTLYFCFRISAIWLYGVGG